MAKPSIRLAERASTAPTDQVDLPFRAGTRGRDLWQRVLPRVRAVVDRIGPKEVAYEADMAGSMLSDALYERERKALRAEALLVVLLLANDSERAAILGELASATGFELQPKRKLTPEELNVRLEDKLREMLSPALAEEAIREARK